MGQVAREPKYNQCFRARNKRAELGKCDWDSKVNQEPNGVKEVPRSMLQHVLTAQAQLRQTRSLPGPHTKTERAKKE
jgi:hypothetical protein